MVYITFQQVISLQLMKKLPKGHRSAGSEPSCDIWSKSSLSLNFCCSFVNLSVLQIMLQVWLTKKEDNKKHNCWIIYVKSPSGLMEIFMFKMYTPSFAICVICHRFYGKSEVGQLTHTL